MCSIVPFKFSYIRSVIGQLFYLIKESFRGYRQHSTVMLPSLLTIFLCSLLLSSSFSVLNLVFRALSCERELYSVEAFLPGNIEEDSLQAVKDYLVHMRSIESVDFVSADSAREDFRRRFSGEMLSLVDDNPIPAFFRLKLVETSMDPANLAVVVNELSRTGFFDEIQAPLEWATRIAEWKFRMIFWPVFVSVLLLATLSLIICNAVRLSLMSRKLLVENMKYAGGSPFFIEFPFVLEGVVQGFVGSLLSVILLFAVVRSLSDAIPAIENFTDGVGYVLAGVVVLVSVVSAYFSFRTVQGFLLSHRSERE